MALKRVEGEMTLDEVLQVGYDLLDTYTERHPNEELIASAYGDLCLGLELIKVKQVNELLRLLWEGDE